jgi:bifunctional non-homologous end joining protein LigD
MSTTELEASGHHLTVSHVDKVLFPAAGGEPAITKGEVLAYYRAVAPLMLPHLHGRPLNLHRFPDGIGAKGFYQQEAANHFPDWLRTVEVPAENGRGSVRHPVVEDEAALLYLANLASVEFHVWLSTADALRKPDLLVVDLDPPDGAEPAELRDAARSVRAVFEELGLTAFVQTTGGRGFHVAAPLDHTAGYDLVRPLAHDVARLLARRDPDRFTTEQRKADRGDRIFLDTNRDAYGQTVVAPYSLRSRPGAPAATPIDWDELSRVEPDRYGLRSLPHRIAQKADPWAELHDHAAPAAAVRDRLAELDG